MLQTFNQRGEGENGVGRRRIVLAEDDAEMRRVVSDALRKAGHDVLEASDATDLVSCLTRAAAGGPLHDDRIDLVVTDIRMPGGNGLDIVESLRATEPRTPVIVMTAFGDDPTRVRAERLGAVLLDKPFRMEALLKTVRKLLGGATPDA